MADVIIFANPIAGRGWGRAVAEQLSERLTRDGLITRTIFERPREARIAETTGQLRAAVVIGGDGTIREVAERMVQSAPGTPLLIVPTGTANLLGQHLGISWTRGKEIDQIADALKRRRIVRLDTARANGRMFLVLAGIGLDAAIVHELDRIRRGPIRKASYVLPAALGFSRYKYPPLTVEVDGQVISRDVPALAFVGNAKEYGTGFPILPHARSDDGVLDICVLPCANRRHAIMHFIHAAMGQHLNAEGVVYTRGRQVRIESSQPVPVQIDGDPSGYTPVSIDLLESGLPFIVP